MLLGLNQALVKLVNAGFAPVFQAGLRSACAILPVLAFALYARRRLSITDGSLAPGLLNGLLFSAEFCLLFLALDYTTVARVSLFFYTMPLWLAVAAHFLLPGERLTALKVLGLAMAMSGVALALSSREASTTASSWLGDGLALAAALCWASIALLTRLSRLSRSSAEMNLLYQLSVSSVLLLLLAPLFGDTIREPTPFVLAIFAFQVLVVVAIGFAVWFWLLSVYPASNMASFSLLAPIVGVFSGWMIFDDPLPWNLLVALVLVLGGIVVTNSRRALRRSAV